MPRVPRIAIVGAGIAGAMLALRLRQASCHADLEVFTGTAPPGGDASGASGGLVRGFETDVEACRTAAESLAEIRSSAKLRDWTGYREIGAIYLLPAGADPAGPITVVDELLPGSATVLDCARLAREYPFRDLPADTVAVAERHAGHISPARLRASVLAELDAGGTAVRPVRVLGVTPDPAVLTADGTTRAYDIVVVAAGAWTPRLLVAGGLPVDGLRTKQIQYSVCNAHVPGLDAFVDETSGLYGRPAERGSFLLGLPSDRWDVDPDAVTADKALTGRVAACARRRLGIAVRPVRTVASFDCYHELAGLRLRHSVAGAPLFTFTGGSGGAAKSVVTASRVAAATLLA